MKSINLIKILSILAICAMVISVKMEKSETVFEFLNNLYSETVSKEMDTLSTEYMYMNALNNGLEGKNVTSAGKKANNGANLGYWLRISSSDFQNKKMFPPVLLPTGEEIAVRVDSNNFRINEAFDASSKDANLPKNPLDFWFRLKDDKIYYSKTKSDVDVIGSISFTDIKMDTDIERFCGKVYENKEEWLICATTDKLRQKFYCQIKTNLGEDINTLEECVQSPKTSSKVVLNQTPKSTIIEDKVIQPIILIPMPSRKCNDNWDYRNKGNDWECTCKTGSEQSPIDLPKPENAILSPVTPLFQYEEVSARSLITTIDGELKAEEFIKIKYFKNALRILHSNFGKIVTLDGSVYIAEEIVFHTPAEHTLNGRRYEMEMQVIHYGQSKGDISKQVILSFMFEKKPGVYNKFIDDVDFFSLPNSVNKERDITNNLFIPKVFYSSSNDEIPAMKPFSFYTYQGSMTFPPCTERTIHYVAADPIPIGSASLQLMKEAIRIPDMFNQSNGEITVNNDDANNYRETQPLNNRAVFFFDHRKYCEGDYEPKKKKVRFDGHYEKLNKKVTNYFYVNGAEPSGLPNSFVVSESEAKGTTIKTKNYGSNQDE